MRLLSKGCPKAIWIAERSLFRGLPRLSGAGGDLASDEVVHLEDVGRASHHDALCRQDRHQPLPELFQLRLRVPNLADLEIAVTPETDVVFKSVWGKTPPRP